MVVKRWRSGFGSVIVIMAGGVNYLTEIVDPYLRQQLSR